MADEMIEKGYPIGDVSREELADTLCKLEKEKIEKNIISDKLLNYNDEILSIEDIGELETVDISVSGDNLFYCNGILTKNSYGLPATCDFLLAIMSTEELEQQGLYASKQLKNRYNQKATNKRFLLGVDTFKMRLFDVEPSTQESVMREPEPVKKFPVRREAEGSRFKGKNFSDIQF
jgi:hypothetical protein